jgi:hypothetical protein
MCCTLQPAHLSKTTLYAGEATHRDKLVHVLAYQNNAKNYYSGPNAMILPFPASEPMGPENCLEAENLKWVMSDLAKAVRPPPRRDRSPVYGALLRSATARSVSVFESGTYTVVLAENANDIPMALDRVPKNKRPAINEEVFDFYANQYKDWPIALCCFESKREMESDPLIWWFEPKYKQTLFAPAVDAHDGHAPDLKQTVRVDHAVVFGSAINPKGNQVRFRNKLPPHLRDFIPESVVGREYDSIMPNGDFILPIEVMASAKPDSSLHFNVQPIRAYPNKFDGTSL